MIVYDTLRAQNKKYQCYMYSIWENAYVKRTKQNTR